MSFGYGPVHDKKEVASGEVRTQSELKAWEDWNEPANNSNLLDRQRRLRWIWGNWIIPSLGKKEQPLELADVSAIALHGGFFTTQKR